MAQAQNNLSNGNIGEILYEVPTNSAAKEYKISKTSVSKSS